MNRYLLNINLVVFDAKSFGKVRIGEDDSVVLHVLPLVLIVFIIRVLEPSLRPSFLVLLLDICVFLLD